MSLDQVNVFCMLAAFKLFLENNLLIKSTIPSYPLLEKSTLLVLFFPSNYNTIPTEFIIKEDVYSRLSFISSSKAAGPDEIPNWVLKSYAHGLALPANSIFNVSLQQAFVPEIWKKADVIPVLKNKVPSDINKDLRPISLTGTLSKTCERFVADWLMHFINEKIDKRQFGSLKNASTTHALLSLIHHLLNELMTLTLNK